MKKKKLAYVIAGAMVSVFAVFMASGSTANANKQWYDFNYDFDKAIIDTHKEVITVDVKSWTDYEDGEQLQIIAKDGTVYLTSSFNCTLIKTR